MNKVVYLALIGTLFAGTSIEAVQPKKKPAQKKVVERTTNKQSTVADVLAKYKSSDRGAKVQLGKFTKLLPESSLPTVQTVRNTKKIKPPSSVKFFIKGNEKEAQIEKILDQQINELYVLSQKFRKSPERGEIWLRLGELYVEKSKMVQYRIQNELDKKLSDWEAKGRKGNPPKIDANAPVVYNRKAIELYSWYIKDFPNSKKLDQAYFFLGYNLVEIGQLKKGTEQYEKLTKEFPRSSYVTESHFALGEFHFDNNDWKKAAENYKRVLRDDSSRIYPFGVYKLGWAHYRLGQASLAIQYMEKVIDISQNSSNIDSKTGKEINKIKLADEAYNDLILFYPDVKPFEGAAAYFEKMGGESRVFSSLEKLAYLYSDRGQREASKFVFNQLIEMKPNSPKNFDYQQQIVQNYASGGSRQTFRQELFNWITNYNSQSDWAAANAGEKQKSFETREATLRGYILNEHKALQKSRNPLGLKLTKNLYELYIKEFNESKNIAEMRFFYGELSYDMGDFDRASDQYKWVMQHAPNSQYYAAAILNELLSTEKSLPTEAELEKIRGQSLDPFEFNQDEKDFALASENYIKKFPGGEKALDIKFKLGRLYYSHNYFDQALVIFKDIVAKNPKTDFAVYSANLILDIYNLRKDYEGLTKAGQELLNTPGLKSSEVTMDIKNVVEKAKFKEAQDLEIKKDFAGSAKTFEWFSKNYPNSQLAVIAKYNAAINYERAGDTFKAVSLYSAFVGAAGKDNEKQKKEARRLIGRIYERTGQLKKAAEEFEKFAKDYESDPLSADLYYNAAVIWSGFRNYSRAIADYEKFYRASKKGSKVDAIFLIAEIHEKKGSITLANRTYEQYINDNPRDIKLVILAAYRIAKNAEKLGQKDKSEEFFKKVIALKRRAGGDIGAREAAEGQFKFTNKTLTDLKSIRIPQNPAQQGRAVQEKLALVNKLNQELAQIVKLDVGEYVIASLATAGQAYEHISDSIYNAPQPKGLTPEQKKMYMEEIDKVAGPLKQQGIDNYTNAINKARQIDIYNDWVRVSRDSLNRINKASRVQEEMITDYLIPKVDL